jgi:hypothetical protein
LHLQLDSRPGITDVSADGLTLRFSATPGLDVVGTLAGTLTAVRLAVVVEVLAASHRVHVLDDDGLLATEQVACVRPGLAVPLPEHATHDVAGHRLQLSAERARYDVAGLARLACGLRSGADDDGSIVVSFPGHRDALTSVRLLADGWETWHLYPGRRPHAVRTHTTVAAT